MGTNDFATILGIGVVGVGGYLFVTQLWPMMKRELEGLGDTGDDFQEEDERRIPPMIVEDRVPDIVYEDRYPDYVVEDRYPDYPPYYVPPVIPPPIISDCPPGTKYDRDLGICEPRCPKGMYFKASKGRCVFSNEPCDSDEYYDWVAGKCRDRNRRDRDRRDRDRKPPEHRFGNNRDKWHQEREKEEKRKKPSKPEKDRVKEITEKAVQSFIEIWEI